MSKELANTVVMPLVTPEEAKAQWQKYQALKASVLDESDFQKIGAGKYTKKSGFRKIATFFGLTDKITEKERVEMKDGFLWRFTVDAIAPNGRITQGVGSCDSRERKFAHVEHDVYATAHTRAKNRAISDMVAGGEVSAEEMEQTTPVHYPGEGILQHPGPRTVEAEVKQVVKDPREAPPVGIYAPSNLSVDSIKQYLDDCGYDAEKFTIRHDEPSRMYVFDKAPWIDDWSSFQDRMRELGADYDQTHKKTVVKY